MPETFTETFAFQYEHNSSLHPRSYEIAARALSTADEGIQDGDSVLEVGSGTGNSTIILALSNPNFGSFTTVEPSPGFLRLAAYKFGQTSLTFPPCVSSEALAYIEEQRANTLTFRDKVIFLPGKASALPVSNEAFDRAYASESFHWFAFETPTSDPDFILLSRSVAEIRRALKQEGKFLFDSNGHIFRFGEEEGLDGRKLDDIHFARHPLRESFNERFFQLVGEMGIPGIQVRREDPSKLHYLFDLKIVRSVLEQNGFEFVPETNGKLYRLTFVPMSLERNITTIKTGARMGHFSEPGLIDLPEETKDGLLDKALERALNDSNAAELEENYFETFLVFVTKKG